MATFAQLGGPLDLKTSLLLAEALPVAEGWIIKGLSRGDEE